jgi:hypothetical protein
MWETQNLEDYDRQHRWYSKKRKRELDATLENLKVFVLGLTNGGKVQHLMAAHRFLRKEGSGIIAVTQWGGGKNLAETRLYVYPDEDAQLLYLLTIGGKDDQSDDVQFCKQFVTDLGEAKTDGQKGTLRPPDG